MLEIDGLGYCGSIASITGTRVAPFNIAPAFVLTEATSEVRTIPTRETFTPLTEIWPSAVSLGMVATNRPALLFEAAVSTSTLPA
jgi:hypothetical protein